MLTPPLSGYYAAEKSNAEIIARRRPVDDVSLSQSSGVLIPRSLGFDQPGVLSRNRTASVC